jgi:pantothenate kinase
VYATGAGCHEFVQHICQKLNIRIGIRAEFDCFVKSFVYMAARLPRTQLLEPFLDDAIDEPLAYVTHHVTTLVECQAKEATRGIYKLTETLNQQLRMSTGRPAALETALVGSMSVDVPLTDEEPDLFPCILVTCGSGTAVMKIEKDGTFRIIDVSSRGGRSFFGIGKLLSGCKTFDELIDLASKGNSRNIDVYSDELFNSRDAAEGDSSSVYDMLNKSIPSLMYSFGKATVDEQTSFSREDIAAAWLNYVTLDLVECLHSLCNRLAVRRVFFCGGFCSSATVRRIITAELARRNMFKWAMSNQALGAVVFDFIKPGQSLGALGCLLTGIDN